MKKRISQAFCAIAATALISIGAFAQQVQKVSKSSAQQSAMTEQMVAPEKGAVQMTPMKTTTTSTMGIRQAQPAGSRLSMPAQSTTMEAVRQATGVVNFAGMVIYTEDEGRKAAGKAVWELTSEGGFGSKLSTAGGVNGGYGACVIGNTYYSIGSVSLLGMNLYYLYSYDMENGFASIAQKSLSEQTLISQTFLYDGANVYGAFYTSTQGEYTFGTIDFATLTVTPIATVNWQLIAGAVDADGNLYGVIAGDESAYLAKINKQTGALTKIGDGLGVQPKYLSGAVIDPKSGRMFYNVCPADETGNLYEINTTTGVATKILQYPGGEEIVGMYVPFSPEPGAPAAPENLTLSFPNGALTGEVSFKTPTTTADGNTATGNVTYKVMENGVQIATAEVAYGKEVKLPVTVSAAGKYTYIVELSNAAGRSYQAKASMYIGNDVPKAPEAVTAAWADGTMTVSWNAVTEGVNGGYMDPAQVTYKVTCGERVVKDNYTGTSLTESITENGRYKYEVVAVFKGVESEAAESNGVTVGTRTLPAEFNFDTQDEFDEFTVIDANDDKATWAYYATGKSARCKWHTSNPMDDWLIAPAVEMKAGKVYKITSVIYNNSTTYTERYEIKAGQGDNVAAMTATVVEPTEVKTKEQVPVTSMFKPTADGNYNIGVHGISDKNQFYLYVVSLKIEEVDPGAPDVATDLTVTPDAAGALSAKIDFKAPSKNLGGGNLTSLTKIELLRGETVIKTFEAPAPGAALTHTDNTMTEGGMYEYSVLAYNDKGVSNPVKASAFVGFDVPVAPTNVTMTEVSNGRVKITWTAPTEDVNGKPLNAADITYEVREAATNYPLVAEVGSVLQYEFDAVEAGQCDFAQFAVFPVNATGRGTGTLTPFMCVGTPIPTPYFEGFDPLVHPLGLQTVNGSGSWTLNEVNESIPYTPDGDEKYLAYKAGGLDASSIAFTGKIDLTNVENPCFSFYTFNITGDVGNPEKYDINEVAVVAREANAAEWTVIKPSTTVHELCGGQQMEWGRVTADLTQFKGKVIQVGVKVTCKFYTYTFFDKWSVMTAYDDNLVADKIDAPASVSAGTTFPVKVKVSNQGKNAANNYTVELYDLASETPLATATVAQHAAYTDTVVEFNHVYAPGEAGEHTLYAKVVYAADKNQDDNTTEGVVVNVKVSNQAAPSGLEATLDNGNQEHVNLTWTAPVPATTQRTATPITDDLESYEAWNYTNAGDWKFVDRDGKPSGGFQNMNISGLTPGETVTSFFTFSSTIAAQNTTFAAHSGNIYFAAMFLYDDGQSNDWLISPVLSGSAQTISFWARSYSSQYPEKIEVYTSTGSENPDDFTVVEGSLVASVPGAWTKYEVTLPAGAKRFAVRSFATGSFMLMLDDFTYEPGALKPAELVGYNVYRDNVKLNSELIPVGTTSFKDTNTKAQTTYNYYVTAVYDNGEESAASNKTAITTSVPGLGMGDVTINVVDNTIVVENATETVTITDMGGVVLFRGVNDRVVVVVEKGAYIVRTGKFTQKVMVK